MNFITDFDYEWLLPLWPCYLCDHVTFVIMLPLWLCYLCDYVTFVTMLPLWLCHLCDHVTFVCDHVTFVCDYVTFVTMLPLWPCYLCDYVTFVTMLPGWLVSVSRWELIQVDPLTWVDREAVSWDVLEPSDTTQQTNPSYVACVDHSVNYSVLNKKYPYH